MEGLSAKRWGKNQDFMLMRFFNPSDLIGRGGDPKPMRFKVRGGVRRGGAQSGCMEEVCGGGAQSGCMEGLSAKRSLRGGGVQRGAQRV